jgi:translation initiation factor 2 alpha subunit (eIF-2alpha)
MNYIQFYGTNKPDIEEIVTCKITKIADNSIIVKLIDYNIDGFLTLSDFTNRKRIRGNRKIAVVGKVTFAKVEEISQKVNGKFNVKLTKAYLNDDDEDVKLFHKTQSSNHKVKQIVKLLVNKFKFKESDIYFKYIHPFDLNRVSSDKKNMHLFDFIKENLDNFLEMFDDIIKESIRDLINSKHKKNNNNTNINTTFKLATLNKNGINHIKTILEEVLNNYNGKVDIIYNLTTLDNKLIPQYIIKSNHQSITKDDHLKILESIKLKGDKETFIQ